MLKTVLKVIFFWEGELKKFQREYKNMPVTKIEGTSLNHLEFAV